jgi:hypothetical protein
MVKGLDWTDPEILYQARVLHYGLQLLVSALLSTPEEKCIDFPEQKYIREAGKKGR